MWSMLSYCNQCLKNDEMTMYLPTGMMIVSLSLNVNLKFDYVLTIRYDDSHSDYSMLYSSEMSEWCFFV